MEYIIIIVAIVLLFANLLVNNKVSKLLLLVNNGWWIVLLYISTLNPFYLNNVSYFTYFLLIGGLICFNIGYITEYRISGNKNIHVHNMHNDILKILENSFDRKVFLIMVSVFVIVTSYYYYKYMGIVTVYGVDEARGMRFFAGKLFGSTAEIVLYNVFISGFSFFVKFVIAISIVFGFKKKLLFYFSCIGLFTFSAIGAGRSEIIDFMFFTYILVIVKKYYFKGNDSNLKKSSKKSWILLICVGVIGYFASIYLTLFRLGISDFTTDNLILGNRVFMEQVLIYLVGAFRALDYSIYNLGEQIGLNFGRLTLGGVEELFSYPIAFAGLSYSPITFEIGHLLHNEIPIGNGITFNALFTHYFYFYFDFGILGVLLLSFFFGRFFQKMIKYFQLKPSILSLMALCLVATGVYLSVLSWKFQSPSSILCLFIVLFFSKYKLKFR